MLKRALSPTPLPPSKRLHVSDRPRTPPVLAPTFDTLLFDELILSIFSYLSYADLCRVQLINRNWSRLAQDNELWKSLYLKQYGKLRLRGGKGFVQRTDGREIRALPSRATSHESELVRDWKWMFRISSNWRTGRCHLHKLGEQATGTVSSATHLSNTDRDLSDRTHMALAGLVTIFASSMPSDAPPISIVPPASQPYTLRARPVRPAPHRLVQVTALAVDQSPPSGGNIRFVVCLSNGELAVHQLHDAQAQASSRVRYYVPPGRTSRTTPILQAAYHHPLLVTLSESFALSLYDASSEAMLLSHHLTSFTSFPPSSLVLTTPEHNAYKLLITYASPVYPAHWSIGVTEVLISASPPSSPSAVYTPSAFNILSTRSVRAYDLPPGWANEAKMRALREQWGRKVVRVAATQTDGKWVVLAPTELPCISCTTSSSSSVSSSTSSSSRRRWTPSSLPLQLYRISFPTPSAGASASPKLTFVRHLYGQKNAVASLALADGRCVSLGVDGSVWAWDLEDNGGVQVASLASDNDIEAEGDADDEENDALCERTRKGLKGLVVFDERRIISSGPEGVVVRNFDI